MQIFKTMIRTKTIFSSKNLCLNAISSLSVLFEVLNNIKVSYSLNLFICSTNKLHFKQ